jgi:uncharacterized phiE125 gp8 family phage protein
VDDDALIASLVRSAIAQVDGRDGWLGRQLITATWRLTLDCFPAGGILVPLPPLQEVTSITYIDAGGAEQTLATSVYQVAGTDPARIVLAYGQSWPATRPRPDAVRVEYIAGYGDSWNDVPEDIRHALICMVSAAYDNCACASAVQLLFKYRAW